MNDSTDQHVLDRTVDAPIGGQAVIEGVMIRSPERISTAVRRPDGVITVKTTPFVSVAKRNRLLRLPVFRGAVSFVEMLVLGIESINFSAMIAAEEEPAQGGAKEPDWKETAMMWGAMAVALAAGFGLFFFLPLAVADLLDLGQKSLSYNAVAGLVRVTIFLLYLWGIGRVRDIKRVFAYHGAEHQTIFAYEAGEEIGAEAAERFTRFHPRCGTSFLLIVALLAIAAYALIDSAYFAYFGVMPVLWKRFLLHMAFLPIVAGLSFEALKLSGKYRHSRIVQILVAPGLWLQRLTTRPPDRSQLEVAAVAARASLGLSTEGAEEYVEAAAPATEACT